MQNKIPPHSAPSRSANDNGPLTTGQVRVLKIAIGVMSALIVLALLAIVARVIYLSSSKDAQPAPPSVIEAPASVKQSMDLPAGAVVKSMSLHGNRLLVHYETTSGTGAAILDLATGRTTSQIAIRAGK